MTEAAWVELLSPEVFKVFWNAPELQQRPLATSDIFRPPASSAKMWVMP